MMKKITLLLITMATILFFSNPLFAASGGEIKTPDELKSKSGEMKQSVYMGSPAKLSGKDLMGVEVVDLSGKKLGTITDIMIDPGMALVNYVTVTMEDGKKSAVPINAFEIKENKAVLTTAGGKEKMEAAPAPPMQETDKAERDYFYELQGHYGIYPDWQIAPRKKK